MYLEVYIYLQLNNDIDFIDYIFLLNYYIIR